MAEKPIQANITNEDNVLHLYGTIGDYWEGVTLNDIKRSVRNMRKDHVVIHINSYGGDAVEGVAIRNFLIDNFEEIDVIIDGIAASAASIIATCGDTLSMPTGTTYMIHNPWTIAFGNKEDLLKEIGALESLETSYKNIYMERFKGTEGELEQLLTNESWLTADEASELGFATEVFEPNKENNEPVVESNLVATLLNKYAASVDPIDAKVDDEPTASVSKDSKDKGKTNNLLQNFAKVFSNFE